MGAIPDNRNITSEDFPEEFQEFADPLVNPINRFNEQVVDLFTKNIDISNLKADYVSINFTTPSNYSSGANLNFTQLKLLCPSVPFPQICLIGQMNRNTRTYGFSNVALTIPEGAWRSLNPGEILINYITGLLPSTNYNAIFAIY